MISVVHGPEPTRTVLAARVLTLVTLTWLLTGAPAGLAAADACAYASTGPDGTEAVAVAGGDSWPIPGLPETDPAATLPLADAHPAATATTPAEADSAAPAETHPDAHTDPETPAHAETRAAARPGAATGTAWHRWCGRPRLRRPPRRRLRSLRPGPPRIPRRPR